MISMDLYQEVNYVFPRCLWDVFYFFPTLCIVAEPEIL